MDALDRTLAWLGAQPSTRAPLEEYARWLSTEAVAAGGIGPGEGGRLIERHIADSLLFAGVWSVPGEVLDIGSGVGLPGIPLAIVAPERHFVLLDRSGRRTDLARRALRILALTNVDVVHDQLDAVDWSPYVVVSRASVPAADLWVRAQALGSPRELLVAGSHIARPEVDGFDAIEIPAEILDRPVWILRMAQS